MHVYCSIGFFADGSKIALLISAAQLAYLKGMFMVWSGARKRNRFAVTAGCVLILATVMFLAYGFVLRLPLFWDDIVHARFVEGRSLWSVWRSARGMLYYRPLPFTVWMLVRALMGRHDATVLHAINLVLHLVNSVLVMLLARRHAPRQSLPLALGAALLFLLYPFSYQAVPWAAAQTHLLVTMLVLSTLLLADEAARRHSSVIWAASLAVAFLAPFAHETGILVAPLLLLYLRTQPQPAPAWRLLQRTWPYAASGLFGLGAWLLAPKGSSEGHLFDLADRWQNAIYMAQGLAYPAAPAGVHM
ncbi:MAG: hypothetical protein ACUVWR_18985, partial [Anaerolineae bacterium]